MDSAATDNLLSVRGLHRRFKSDRGLFKAARLVHAVNGVSFDVSRGETLALVGESGCGKSTIGRLVLGLDAPDEGGVLYDGVPVSARVDDAWRDARKRVQMIFQDASGTLDPRKTVSQQVREPLDIHRVGAEAARVARVSEVLSAVGLDETLSVRYPHELSGGQQQRVIIARALVLEPEFIVCDEPVSGLDVSVQAQVVNLLHDLKDRFGITYLFISHDLAVVRHIADRAGVLYLGGLVEVAAIDDLFTTPRHPYTQALIAAVPVPDPTIERGPIRLQGDPPSPVDLPAGCPFRSRCPLAGDICAEEKPALREFSNGHFAACHMAEPGEEAR